MQTFFVTMGLSLLMIAIAFSAIGIKMFLVKGGQFTKQCSTVDTGNTKIGCTCGAKDPEERCENFEEHHGKGADGAKRHIHTETMVIKSY